MKTLPNTTHNLGSLPTNNIFYDEAWSARALIDLDDRALIDVVIVAITSPKAAATTSFVLHAPLELSARAALLPMVASPMRSLARQRIAEIAVQYATAGTAVVAPQQPFGINEDAFSQLFAAIEAKYVDDADAAITYLAANTSIAELRHRLIDAVAPLLSAAGHAPILLVSLPMLDKQFAGAKMLLRAPIRALAKASELRVSWHLAPRAYPQIDNTAEQLQTALAAAPRVASASNSIAPTVLAVERSGDATRLLAPLIDSLNITDARRVLLRIAAWSMLQDDPKHAPYGWTHCLTLPQALLQNADASQYHQALIAVAATEVLGFRATTGCTNLDATLSSLPPAPAIEALATFAATHRDAHVAKYTLACLQAAVDDREAAALFMSAAAYLHDWWRRHDAQ
jgi:predicted nuclease with RNAse H fold